MKRSFFAYIAAVGALCCSFASNAEAQTLHLVTVANPAPLARTARLEIINDVENVRDFFLKHVPASRLKHLDLLNPTAAEVEASLDALAVESDDVVVFYFTGGAGNELDGAGHVFQLFNPAETRLPRQTVRRALAQKEPRLVVLLTDCANVALAPLESQVANDDAPKVAEATQASESDGAKAVSPFAQKFLFEPSGRVDVTSSKLGQYSFAGDERSLATAAWLAVFEKANETLKNDSDAEIDWRGLAVQMIAETEKRFQEKFPEGVTAQGLGQDAQTPHVYEIPVAPRLGARVQTREKELVVTQIFKGSPAARAEMKAGDALVAIRYLDTMQEIRPVDETQYADAIDYAPRDVEITVKRRNGEQTKQEILTVRLNGAPLPKPEAAEKPEETTVEADVPQNQPAQNQPIQAQPAQDQPAQNQPAQDQPAQDQPVQSQPVQSQPAPSQPAQSQPAQPDPNGPVFGATVQGRTIVAVVPNSPAAIAGLQVGDQMLSFNGAPIRTGYDFSAAVDQSNVDATLVVLRQTGAQETVLARLNKNSSQPTPPTQPQPDPNGPVFGATVQGQEITAVVPNSPAAIAGLQVGEKIIVFNGEPIQNAFEYSNAVDKSDVEAFLRVLGLDGVVRDVIVALNKK